MVTQDGAGPEKPKPVRIKSDDCVVLVQGQQYHVHRGEWIETYVGVTAGQLANFDALADAHEVAQQVKGDPDGGRQSIRAMSSALQQTMEALADRITAWNWTDHTGAALPKPYKDPGAFKTLTVDELIYLTGAVQGETEEQRGNGMSGSLTGSSDTAPPQSPT